MPLSAVSVLDVAQSSSEIPEGLINNPVYVNKFLIIVNSLYRLYTNYRCFQKTLQ